jgi:parallel beta-helix repeat protein
MTLTSNATIKAAAFKSGYNPSAVAAATFTNSVTNTTGTGKTYYVATNGSDSNPGTISQPFGSIRKSVSVLQAGDTVYIRGGTYNQNLNSNRDVIPNGTSWSNAVTIAAYPGETVTITGPTGDQVINIASTTLNPTQRYIVFDGLIIDGVNVRGGNPAIGIGSDGIHAPPDHIRFINIEVKNVNSTNGQPGGAAPGILATGTFHEFVNCNVHNNGLTTDPGGWAGYGFYVNGSDHLIENCQIHDNGGYGIQAYKWGGGADRITIRNNQIYNNGLYSTATTGGLIVASGSGHKVYNNIVQGNYDGIEVNCSNCLVYNNTVYGNRSLGIAIGAAGVNSLIKNNISYSNALSNVDDSGSGNVLSNNLTTNPRFVNPSGSDFRLQSGSPAIDSGATLVEVTTDILGMPRPQRTAYDIGAYEYR